MAKSLMIMVARYGKGKAIPNGQNSHAMGRAITSMDRVGTRGAEAYHCVCNSATTAQPNRQTYEPSASAMEWPPYYAGLSQ